MVCSFLRQFTAHDMIVLDTVIICCQNVKINLEETDL